MTDKKLTHKQRIFVDKYLQCWNATDAARRAGYSERTARQIGSRLLTNVDISAEIDRRMQQHAMEANEVLHHLSTIAKPGFGVEIRDRLRALELLGKHHGLFVDKTEQRIEHKITIAIQSGDLRYDDLENELGSELAANYFEQAGVPVAQAKEVITAGE